MKKFVVSEKCIACGNCLLETKLLQEDAEGKAVPVMVAILVMIF